MIVIQLFKFILVSGILIAILVVLAIGGSFLVVKLYSRERTYTHTQTIPGNHVGIVLGTNPISSRTHRSNPYYYYRIEAAAQLYREGKIRRIIVSGDNRHKSYNEPEMMKADLIKAGVSAHHIYCDYAGFRTLDSIVRAKKVFGLQSCTIISQRFHNERAICLARWQGIDAIAFNAKDIKLKKGKHVQMREALARCKMILDILVNKQPHFLGERIEVK